MSRTCFGRRRFARSELAFLAAVLAARQLAYEASAHPDRVGRFIEGLERKIAPWWREVL